MKKVLVAVELNEEAGQFVLRKALAACAPGATLEVVHVVDASAVKYSVDPTMTGKMYDEMYQQTLAAAAARLDALCAPLGIDKSRQHIRYGRVAHEIHELLIEGGYDTCMVGSHGYSGWQRVLGSKAASVLHGVPVDTWVFRLPKPQKN